MNKTLSIEYWGILAFFFYSYFISLWYFVTICSQRTNWVCLKKKFELKCNFLNSRAKIDTEPKSRDQMYIFVFYAFLLVLGGHGN